MGYQDREYYQEEQSSGGFQFRGDLSYTWRIVIVNVALFLANFILANNDNWITELLSVHGDTIVKPWMWWQFLTYGFVHASGDLGHIFWNMLGLVFFGSAVEEMYGRREFLRFYLVSILIGGIFWGARVYLATVGQFDLLEASFPNLQEQLQDKGITYQEYLRKTLADASLLGASGGVTAVTLLFCLRNPFATVYLMMVLPVPAWVLGVIIIVGDIFQAGQSLGTIAHDVHLCGAGFAVAYFYYGWNLTRTLNFTWLTQTARSIGKLMKARPKLKVYDDDPDAAYRELEAEADRILLKISQEGEGSLTRQERQTLERYSRLMRQKHR